MVCLWEIFEFSFQRLSPRRLFLSSFLEPVLVLVKDEAIYININLCPSIRDPKPTVPFLMPLSIMIWDTGLGYLGIDAYTYLLLMKCLQRTRCKRENRQWVIEDTSEQWDSWCKVLMSVLWMPWSRGSVSHTRRSSVLEVPVGLGRCCVGVAAKGSYGPFVQRHQRWGLRSTGSVS